MHQPTSARRFRPFRTASLLTTRCSSGGERATRSGGCATRPRVAADLASEFNDWIAQETRAEAIAIGDELKLVGISHGPAPLPREGRS